MLTRTKINSEKLQFGTSFTSIVMIRHILLFYYYYYFFLKLVVIYFHSFICLDYTSAFLFHAEEQSCGAMSSTLKSPQ